MRHELVARRGTAPGCWCAARAGRRRRASRSCRGSPAGRAATRWVCQVAARPRCRAAARPAATSPYSPCSSATTLRRVGDARSSGVLVRVQRAGRPACAAPRGSKTAGSSSYSTTMQPAGGLGDRRRTRRPPRRPAGRRWRTTSSSIRVSSGSSSRVLVPGGGVAAGAGASACGEHGDARRAAAAAAAVSIDRMRACACGLRAAREVQQAGHGDVEGVRLLAAARRAAGGGCTRRWPTPRRVRRTSPVRRTGRRCTARGRWRRGSPGSPCTGRGCPSCARGRSARSARPSRVEAVTIMPGGAEAALEAGGVDERCCTGAGRRAVPRPATVVTSRPSAR